MWKSFVRNRRVIQEVVYEEVRRIYGTHRELEMETYIPSDSDDVKWRYLLKEVWRRLELPEDRISVAMMEVVADGFKIKDVVMCADYAAVKGGRTRFASVARKILAERKHHFN